MATSPAESVVVGQFSGPHGVRGQFKVRSFTEIPADVAGYGSVTTPDGRKLTLKLMGEPKPGLFIATAPEIKTREDCDLYKGAVLQVPRSALPAADDDEFYHSDLVGLSAITTDGAPAGKIKAVVNFGAGDILEIIGVPDHKGAVLIPFTLADVPSVDIAGKTVTVVLPIDDPNDDPDIDPDTDPSMDDGASPA